MHTLETASTCTIEQAHSPAAITVLRDVTDSNTEHNERKQRSRAKRGREEQTDSKRYYNKKCISITVELILHVHTVNVFKVDGVATESNLTYLFLKVIDIF